MSVLDAAPPNTHAGGNDDALETKGSLPTVKPNARDALEQFDAEAYRAQTPRWMLLLATQSFCGPAMADAISGLGGGGLATASTSNIATAINYTMVAVVCLLGGTIVNKIGTKWCLVIGAMSFPIRGSSYYCNSKFGTQWYLIVGALFTGTGSGFWYIAEAGSMMSIAPAGARGKYLALWIVARNLGQLVGGAINIAKNHNKGASGGITPDTYIAFLIIECMALPFAFLITDLKHVVRSDGTRIRVSPRVSTLQELKQIKVTLTSKLILLFFVWGIWSFFYSGTWSTYLATYFSVRARALSSLISPFFCIVGCFGLGFILDIKGLSQRRRAQLGFFTVVALNLGVYIWSIVMQIRFNAKAPGKIDWDDSRWAESFLPYFFVQTTGPLSQSYGFWLLSSFASDAQSLEAIGQAVAYGMNTQTKANPLIGFAVTFALMGVAFIPTLILVNRTPDRIPADVLMEAEEQDKLRQEAEILGRAEEKGSDVGIAVVPLNNPAPATHFH